MRIVATNLGKRFNREWIFKGFSFEFIPNKIYAITGPNGSGKSTLLQVLWGQMPPSNGEVSYYKDNQKIIISEVFNHLSIATPYMDLIDEFTLEEMVKFHFKFKSINSNLTISQVIEATGLASSNDKTIANFSSGMRQRLKLGLAFHTKSEVIYLDEPTTNLDKGAIQWYWDQLNQLIGKKTILIASNIDTEYPTEAKKIDILAFK